LEEMTEELEQIMSSMTERAHRMEEKVREAESGIGSEAEVAELAGLANQADVVREEIAAIHAEADAIRERDEVVDAEIAVWEKALVEAQQLLASIKAAKESCDAAVGKTTKAEVEAARQEFKKLGSDCVHWKEQTTMTTSKKQQVWMGQGYT